MRKKLLTFYDKIVIAALLGILSFVGCARKSYPEKRENAESHADSTKIIDTDFNTQPIAMYGVRPTRHIE